MRRIGFIAASVIVVVMLSFSTAKAELATVCDGDERAVGGDDACERAVTFRTIGGDLVLKPDERQGGFIFLNGKKIFEPHVNYADFVTLGKIFHLTENGEGVDVALVSYGCIEAGCVNWYSFIIIKKDKSVSTLKNFAHDIHPGGYTDGSVRIKQEGNTIVLVFPQYVGEPDKVVIYSNRHITRTEKKKSETQKWSELYALYKGVCLKDDIGSGEYGDTAAQILRILPDFKRIGLDRDKFFELCRESYRKQKPLTIHELRIGITKQKH